MHRRTIFAGIFVLGSCLLLTGCPNKTTPPTGGDPAVGETGGQKQVEKPVAEALPQPEADPADMTTAIALLEQNQGTYAKNDAGAIVAIDLKLSTVLDPASQGDQDDGRTVADTDYNNSVGELFDAINKLADLEKVTFDGPGIDDFGVLRLSDLKKVTTVHFKNTNITTESLKTLATTMQDLTDLSVNRCLNLNAESLSVIANEMPKLRILDLQSNAFKTFDLRALANMPELKQLDLRQCTQIEGESLRFLAGISSLEVLKLRGTATSFRDRDIEHLAGHPSLKAFFLQDANVSDDFLDPLLEISTLIDLSMFRLLDVSNEGLQKLEGAKLQRLFIRENDLIDDEGIAILKTMPDLNRLTLYEVRSITDEGLITAISGNKKLANLALYDMESITDESRKALATTTSLRSMELRKTGQTDETLKLAAKLPRLETMIIGDNSKFTDEGLAALGESKTLKTIEIRNITGITDQGIRDFRARYPNIVLNDE
ncbi:MAG: hypothetical protein FWH27_03745 [Planctomycetaceae bacterium]|nr:hypothetical protein [Planctomycetaceae bacterium]